MRRFMQLWLAPRVARLLCFGLVMLICGSRADAEGPSVAASAPFAASVEAGGVEAEVAVFNRTITTFRAPMFGVSPVERARRTRANLERLLERTGPGTITVQVESPGHFVLVDGTLALIVSNGDVDAVQGETLEQAVQVATQRLAQVIGETRESRDLASLLRSAVKAGIASVVFGVAIMLLNRARRAGQSALTEAMHRRADRLRLAGAEMLRRDQLAAAVRFATTALYWFMVLSLTFEWLGFVLSGFPYTRPWGEQLHGYMLRVLLQVGGSVLNAIPNLAIAVLVFFAARTVIALIRPAFDNIERGFASTGWLDRDTVGPTRRIATALIWIFALVMAYPYLPGAQTEAFKGVSVLIGLMISLGSSSVIGQGASGLILMYARALRRGEYVRIGEHEGTVTEVGMFITRIRTGLGEEINLPNSLVLGSATKNYSRTVKGAGYVVDTTVTIGYDTPWRQVDAMLTEAARRTPGILSDPQPRVFQTALSDFYPEYRLVCQAVPEAPRPRAEVLNALHGNIQDVFNEHGVQIMSPHYRSDPDEAKVVPPDRWYTPPAARERVFMQFPQGAQAPERPGTATDPRGAG
jgi:small-conductance mechanosensitive channel